MTESAQNLATLDDRLDRLINIDLGQRGVEHLYAAARNKQGGSLVGAAADLLDRIAPGDTVIMTSGSVTRSWLSPQIAENDGPAGLAAMARTLSLAKRANLVVLAEETLLKPIASIMTVAGLTALPLEQMRIASGEGSLAAVTLHPFTTEAAEAPAAAAALLDELAPALLFSTERIGRNADGIYCNMRGRDNGVGRARIDYVFDEAIRRGTPTVAVGDGGNEIGMGLVGEAVRSHVKFGDQRAGGGAGIGAITGADVLVTAAVSNWGCYAIAAALAARHRNARLLHSAAMERALLSRGTEVGLINSVDGIIDANVDGIALSTHMAIAELIQAIVAPALDKR
jgi:D-glutamate cyclase